MGYRLVLHSHRRLAHNLRQFWRLRVANLWLASSRRDAAIASDAGFSFTESCINSLRSSSRKVDGHARQVMCGGLAVEAHATHIPNTCSCCNAMVVPCTDHVYWVCPYFQDLRSLGRPNCSLTARLGWNAHGASQVLTQMAHIRERYCSLNLHRKRAGRLGGGLTKAHWSAPRPPALSHAAVAKSHTKYGTHFSRTSETGRQRQGAQKRSSALAYVGRFTRACCRGSPRKGDHLESWCHYNT